MSGNTGNANGVYFTNIENLRGGSSDDNFVFMDGTIITGNIDGNVGNDTIDYSIYNPDVNVDLENNTATATGSINSIENFIGGSGNNTLVGENTNNTFNITDDDEGNINGVVNFTNFENLQGGSSDDNFVFMDGKTVTGNIDGNSGNDSIDYSNYTTNNTFNITDDDEGNINGVVNFTNFENLQGGSSDDNFVFMDGKTVTGNIDGNVGNDSIDYSNYTTDVNVDLENNTATATGSINSIENFTGGSSNNTLVGENTNNTFNITDDDEGNIKWCC